MDKWDLFHPTAQLKIAVTSQCTNNCSICFNKTGRLTNQQRSDIPKEKILDLLDEASNIGFIGAYWVGGEPLLRFTDLVDSMQYATKKGMLSTVVTNSGPIGAIGKYKSNNVDLLKRSGLFNLSAEEIVQRLQDAGLTKIYLSVDNIWWIRLFRVENGAN